MALLTRTWPALASWGSGLLHLSLGASVMLAAKETGGVAAAVAVGLLLCGAAELLWERWGCARGVRWRLAPAPSGLSPRSG